MSRLSKIRQQLARVCRATPAVSTHGLGNSSGWGLVEPLESRLLLTAYLVNSILDDAAGVVDGQLTLREAIIAAETNLPFGDAGAGSAAGDTITFAAALQGQTINLTQGELTVSDDLVIDGGTRNVRLLGQGAARIFKIDTSEAITISGLRVQGGFAVGEGGAAWLNGSGSVTFDTMTFSTNVADGVGGGAIYSTIATLTIQQSTLSNNDADGINGAGGALLVDSGTVTITTSNFTGNQANRGGGGINIEAGTLNLTGVNFTSNVAGTTSFQTPGNGGALRIGGAEVTVTVSGGTIQINEAAHEGGGIWNQAGSSLSIGGGATFFANKAKGNAADDGGGALFNNGGTLTVLNSTFVSNVASGTAGSGGAIFTAGGLLDVRNSTLKTNEAVRAGGGIEVFDGSVELHNVTLGGPLIPDKNTAGREGSGNPGDGGGLHISGGIGTNVLISGGSIQNNQALRSGGGIWNSGGAGLTIENGTEILNNVALGSEATQGGGGIFSDGGTLTISDAFVSENEAGGLSARGGGIFSTGGNLTITGTTISGNKAQKSGGGVEVTLGNVLVTSSSINSNLAGYDFGANPGNGGGFHLQEAVRLELRNSVVANNEADKQGGGIWNSTTGTVIVRNSTVSGNTARGSVFGDGGGGIYSSAGVTRLIGSAVVGNVANGLQGRGGGLLVQAGTLNARDGSQISGNSAVISGGGVEFVNGYTRIDDSSLGGATVNDGNTLTSTSGDGAGFHNSGNNPDNYILWNNVLVQNNVAPRSGGGVWLQTGSTLSVRGSSVFSGNVAEGAIPETGGGAIYNHGGNVRLFGSTFTDNSATGLQGNGGAIYLRAGVLNTREGTTFLRNHAAQGGGAIEVANGYASLTATTLGGAALVDANQARFGAGLHVSGTKDTKVILDSSAIRYNEAEVGGGGLWNQNGAYMLLRNGTVVNFNLTQGIGNSQGGGGIFNQTGGIVEIQNSQITDNISNGVNGSAGGIYNAAASQVILQGATVSGNSTRGQGGGIYNAGTLSGDALSTVFANLALGDAGGIFVAIGGINQLNGTVVASNSPNNIVFE